MRDEEQSAVEHALPGSDGGKPQQPADGHVPAADGHVPAADGHLPPADGRPAPTEGRIAPEGHSAPDDGRIAPGDGLVTPGDSRLASSGGQALPGGPAAPSAGPEPQAGNGEVPSAAAPPGPREQGQREQGKGGADDAKSGQDKSGQDKDGQDKDGQDKDKDGQDKAKAKTKRKQRGSFLREMPILVVIALALALIIKTYAFQAYFIPSGSMQNTLGIGDKVLVNKIVYHLRAIHRGDIVVFNGQGSWNPGPPPAAPNPFDRLYHAVIGLFGAAPGQTDYIKRVIGIPGDHVACCDAQGRVTVNGVPLNEKSYLYPGNRPSVTHFSITVPPGRLWVMGDHRAVSDDSRDHVGYPGGGTIPENEVVGRAFWIVWPPSRWRVLPIPATFEQQALNSNPSQRAAARRVGSDPAWPDSLSVPAVPAAPVLPLAVGFVGAVPLTWGQRKLRTSARRRRARRRLPAAGDRSA